MLTLRLMQEAGQDSAGSSGPVVDTVAAVGRLDAPLLQRVLVDGAAVRLEQSSSREGFDFGRYWLHSLVVAHVAEVLAGLLGSVPTQTAYVTGLLHDIGRVVIDQTSMASKPRAILDTPAVQAGRLCDMEEMVLGTNHAQIGARYLEGCGIADVVCQAVRYHHASSNDADRLGGPAKHLAHILQAADAWALGCNHYVHPLDEVPLVPDPILTSLEKAGVTAATVKSKLSHVLREVETAARFRRPASDSRASEVVTALRGAYVGAIPPELDPVAWTLRRCLGSMASFPSVSALLAGADAHDVVVVNLLHDRAPDPVTIVRRWTRNDAVRMVPLVLLSPRPVGGVDSTEDLSVCVVVVTGPVREATLLAALSEVGGSALARTEAL